MIEIGRARKKQDVLDGVERWKQRHPDAAAHLQPADVLVDSMRGRSSTWTRVRINLQHVPEALRPAQEALDPNEDINDWGEMDVAEWEKLKAAKAAARASTRARKPSAPAGETEATVKPRRTRSRARTES